MDSKIELALRYAGAKGNGQHIDDFRRRHTEQLREGLTNNGHLSLQRGKRVMLTEQGSRYLQDLTTNKEQRYAAV